MKNRMPLLKYPIGVQSFKQIRENGFLYIDKTEKIWMLANLGKYYFLSRPRRFGKSLMLSTLKAYFLGQKELFEGLAINEYEKDWVEYPVFHFDFNPQIYDSVDALKMTITRQLEEFETTFGLPKGEGAIPDRFISLIKGAFAKTGRNAVILVDEYDKALLATIDNKPLYEEFQTVLKGFYGVLKTCDEWIRFVMITGVGRFAHVSIFSDLNNLNDISLDKKYNDLCGISETEFNENFGPEIEEIARRYRMTPEEAKSELKLMYDGYRFTDPEYCEGIYNPFSLLNCFSKSDMSNYWFSTGTPTFLVKLLMRQGYNFSHLDFKVDDSELKGVNNPEKSVVSLLYQTGYLTIKSFDYRTGTYTIGLPNREVKSGLYRLAFVIYGGPGQELSFRYTQFATDLENGDVEGFIQRLKSLFANIPHEQMLKTEAAFHNVIFLLFTLLGYITESEHHVNTGISDLVIKTPGRVYIFEFKLNSTAKAAMEQINSRHYDEPYRAEGRQIIKVGINFSTAARNIDDWEVM